MTKKGSVTSRFRLRSGISAIVMAGLLQAGTALAAPAPPTQYQRQAPAGAPNVVVVLLDDVGFGAASTFGGPATTPSLEAVAKDGLRYNRFHTTAICSPTRASLLTGRNPHAVGVGAVMNSADPRPGYIGFQTKEAATIAEMLRQNGYSTAAFGKWHQTPDWEVTQSGPFDRWPTGQGFEKFYGFQGGETDQYDPTLYDGTSPILRPAVDNYHLTEDLADRAITWMRTQRSVTPGKPFFLYFAPGAIHAPIQVPQAYVDKYKGRFEQGWDKLREEIYARQLKAGVIPRGTKLTPRPDALPAWDSLTPDQKRFASRQMEAYAAFLEHTDMQVGRLVKELKDRREFDNTLFIYVVGDNGASAEGGLGGSLNYMGTLMGIAEPEAAKTARIDQIGSADAYAHVNAAWAWATNAPFPWTKTIASHLGGTRNPLVISWPARIADKGGLRSQFGHVNDITPTILEAVGIEAPKQVNGVSQMPMHGTSLVYSFTQGDAPERHRTQYFEVFGNRAIYHDGWMASAFHDRLPWEAVRPKAPKPMEQDVWELYDLRNDFSQSTDLAAADPDKLAAMQTLFMEQAKAYQLLPLGGISLDRAGMPSLSEGLTSATYYPGMISVPESALPRMPNRSWQLTADVDGTAGSRGVIATLGGKTGGWSLYLDDQGRPTFRLRLFDLKTVTLAADRPLSPGQHNLQVNFDYDGGGWAKGGTVRLLVDGKPVAEDRLPASTPAFYSINETFDVGIDTGSPAGDYPADADIGYAFRNGTINKVNIDLQ